MKGPRITIITPSFNQAAFLERTIRSVLDQRYSNLEYFVIDGGSTDGSVDIIRRYAGDLAGWVSERDGGQTDAINKGLAGATGDVIAFLNSDDTYAPGALPRVAELMASGEKRWLVGGCTSIDANDRVIDRFAHHAPPSLLAYLAYTGGMIPQPSSFWAAEVFERHGWFDRSLHYCFDYEFNARLLAGGETPVMIDETLANFRVHEASKGVSQAIKFGVERVDVAARYMSRLPFAQQLELHRNLGYRRRCYAIQQAQSNQVSLWGDVARRPWWLASGDVRTALRTRRAA